MGTGRLQARRRWKKQKPHPQLPPPCHPFPRCLRRLAAVARSATKHHIARIERRPAVLQLVNVIAIQFLIRADVGRVGQRVLAPPPAKSGSPRQASRCWRDTMTEHVQSGHSFTVSLFSSGVAATREAAGAIRVSTQPKSGIGTAGL